MTAPFHRVETGLWVQRKIAHGCMPLAAPPVSAAARVLRVVESGLLQTLIDSLPDYIYVKDVNSRFVVTNIACAHQLGAAHPDDVVEKSDADFVAQELAAQYRADELAMMQSGQVVRKEERTQHKESGEMRWVLTIQVPLKSDDGKIVGLMGIGRDITKLKQAEEVLRREHGEPERCVAERTAEPLPSSLLRY